VLDVLAESLRRPSPWKVADIGAGTGIFTKRLLERGHQVFAVEPNAAMREAAEQQLGGHRGFRSLNGCAESTGLPDASVDLVTAAQAFHWFDPAAARGEFQRILKPGCVEALLTKFGTDYKEVGQRNHPTDTELSRFFGRSDYERRVLPNAQTLDLAGLRGRVLSASYMPKTPGPVFEAMMADLERLFAMHQAGGVVTLEYETEIYLGPLA